MPPKDPGALAERVAHLYHHPKLLGAFSRQAVQRANDLFNWKKVTRDLAAAYEGVIAELYPYSLQPGDHLSLADEGFETAIHALQESQRLLRNSLLDAATELTACLERGGKVLICGNGGSAAQAQHFAAELVGRFEKDGRPALPALALSADSAIVTAWSNDSGFENVFSRQVEAYGSPGDVLVGLSTSGRSKNVARAFLAARRKRMRIVAIAGSGGGDIRRLADVGVIVPSHETQHIQEVHLVLIHLLCRQIEDIVTERKFSADEVAAHRRLRRGEDAAG